MFPFPNDRQEPWVFYIKYMIVFTFDVSQNFSETY